jgi:hypothetical protein
MSSDRTSLGYLLAAIGSLMLGLAVFLPWYDIHFSPEFLNGIDQFANGFGAFGGLIHAGVSALRAGPISVSAHDVLKQMNVELLIVAGGGLLISLAGLSRGTPLFGTGDGVPLGLLGALAAVSVAYRMIDPPGTSFANLSLREGAWIALLSALALLAGGGLVAARSEARATGDAATVWSDLSGWTPGS